MDTSPHQKMLRKLGHALKETYNAHKPRYSLADSKRICSLVIITQRLTELYFFLVFKAKHIFKEEPKEPRVLFTFNTPRDINKWQVLCDRDVGGMLMRAKRA